MRPIAAISILGIFASSVPGQSLPFPMTASSHSPHEILLAPSIAAFKHLAAMERVTLTGVPVPGKPSVRLQLRRTRLHLGSNAVHVDGVAGHRGPAEDTSFWSGTVEGQASSQAFLAFSRHGSRGWFGTPGKFVHMLAQPGPNKSWSTSRSRLVTDYYLATTGYRPRLDCNLVQPPIAPIQPNASSRRSAGAGPFIDAPIAFETDFEFFQLFNDLAAAKTYAFTLLGAVSDRYRQQMDVIFTLPYVGFHTSNNDPWTKSICSDRLNQFRSKWRRGGAPVPAQLYHMISGVKAEVAIKLYGNNLDMLRRKADEMKMAIQGVAGVTDLQVEQQVIIPQLRIEIDGNQLEQFGLTRDNINEFIETAMNGVVVSQVLEGQRTFDLLVRMKESYREDLEAVKRLSINLPGGGTTTLGSVTKVYRAGGPNTIKTEKVQRRIVVQCNTSGRGLVDVVQDIKHEIDPIADALPAGYFVEYGGQFESQQSASRVIAVLFLVSLCGMFLLLFSMFRSLNLALQVMIALPMAFIGSVAALYFTGQTLTVASMVGFISLCGIASRNGILLINHYLHLVQFEGETWSKEMIVRAGQERLAPVLMTALTSGIALVPLAMAAGEPGKEILYPVATVIIGGLISSTILEFLVRPALFWKFGRRALDHRISNRELDLVAPAMAESP